MMAFGLGVPLATLPVPDGTIDADDRAHLLGLYLAGGAAVVALIDGASTRTLTTRYAVLTLISDGTDWNIV